ncbi:hypothetical protein [Candidatus Burkholderia verschuerenii]|uniref:hypothetical protein n=1 Tax=Candidatus Burkholderia verschuerenii TaxID=242163 RepID=UPI00067B35FB|nr:hypothetical protein [Candidatus Burkholderia verschuerenii]
MNDRHELDAKGRELTERINDSVPLADALSSTVQNNYRKYGHQLGRIYALQFASSDEIERIAKLIAHDGAIVAGDRRGYQ